MSSNPLKIEAFYEPIRFMQYRSFQRWYTGNYEKTHWGRMTSTVAFICAITMNLVALVVTCGTDGLSRATLIGGFILTGVIATWCLLLQSCTFTFKWFGRVSSIYVAFSFVHFVRSSLDLTRSQSDDTAPTAQASDENPHFFWQDCYGHTIHWYMGLFFVLHLFILTLGSLYTHVLSRAADFYYMRSSFFLTKWKFAKVQEVTIWLPPPIKLHMDSSTGEGGSVPIPTPALHVELYAYLPFYHRLKSIVKCYCCRCANDTSNGDSSLTYDMYVTYVGQISEEGTPDGFGCWKEESYYGEKLVGYWSNGQPVGPYKSREQGRGSGFMCVRVGYAQYTSKDTPLEIGIADVECSVSGGFFRGFPAVVLEKSPLTVKEHRRFIGAARRLVQPGKMQERKLRRSSRASVQILATDDDLLESPWVPTPLAGDDEDIQVSKSPRLTDRCKTQTFGMFVEHSRSRLPSDVTDTPVDLGSEEWATLSMDEPPQQMPHSSPPRLASRGQQLASSSSACTSFASQSLGDVNASIRSFGTSVTSDSAATAISRFRPLKISNFRSKRASLCTRATAASYPNSRPPGGAWSRGPRFCSDTRHGATPPTRPPQVPRVSTEDLKLPELPHVVGDPHTSITPSTAATQTPHRFTSSKHSPDVEHEAPLKSHSAVDATAAPKKHWLSGMMRRNSSGENKKKDGEILTRPWTAERRGFQVAWCLDRLSRHTPNFGLQPRSEMQIFVDLERGLYISGYMPVPPQDDVSPSKLKIRVTPRVTRNGMRITEGREEVLKKQTATQKRNFPTPSPPVRDESRLRGMDSIINLDASPVDSESDLGSDKGVTGEPSRFRDMAQQYEAELEAEGWIHMEDAGCAEVLLYIHGYNNSLKESLQGLGQMAAFGNYPNHIKIFVFSWPSGTSFFQFFTARRNAEDTNTHHALRDLLDAFRRNGITNVHVLCHSMGTRLFLKCFREISKTDLFRGIERKSELHMKSTGAMTAASPCEMEMKNIISPAHPQTPQPEPKIDRRELTTKDFMIPKSASDTIAETFFAKQSSLTGLESDGRRAVAFDRGGVTPAAKPKGQLRLISAIFLNPEYYVDEFVAKDYDTLRSFCNQITIFGDSNDRALGWSETVMRRRMLGRSLFLLKSPAMPRNSSARAAEAMAQGGPILGTEEAFLKMPPRMLNTVSFFQRPESSSAPPEDWLDLDVIDTTFMDQNVHAMRHSFWNLNREIIEDIRELLVTRKRAMFRKGRLDRRVGNVWVYRVAPSYVTSIFDAQF